MGVKPPFTHTGDTPTVVYVNSFEAIQADVPYRPSNLHQKSIIPGIQLAKVVGGPEGTVNCDAFGRVRVSFPWDSQSHGNDTGSCWVRVVQAWAGNGYGTLFVPRVGMDVLIVFLNGDPDRPFCVGAAYSEANKPPGKYPEEMNTVSSLRTNSVDGSGCNELRVNDKGGEEEIFVHAQKDFVILTEHDAQETIEEGSKTLTIKKGDYSVFLDEGNHEFTVKKGNQSVTLNDGNLTIDVTGNISIKASGNISVDCDGEFSVNSGKDSSIKSSTNMTLHSENGFHADCQKATLESTSSLEVKSQNVKINGGTSVEVSGMQIKIAATAKMDLSGAISKYESTGTCTISGGGRLAVSAAVIQLG
jgi:type VI secretion system secreted protein VgrG